MLQIYWLRLFPVPTQKSAQQLPTLQLTSDPVAVSGSTCLMDTKREIRRWKMKIKGYTEPKRDRNISRCRVSFQWDSFEKICVEAAVRDCNRCVYWQQLFFTFTNNCNNSTIISKSSHDLRSRIKNLQRCRTDTGFSWIGARNILFQNISRDRTDNFAIFYQSELDSDGTLGRFKQLDGVALIYFTLFHGPQCPT